MRSMVLRNITQRHNPENRDQIIHRPETSNLANENFLLWVVQVTESGLKSSRNENMAKTSEIKFLIISPVAHRAVRRKGHHTFS